MKNWIFHVSSKLPHLTGVCSCTFYVFLYFCSLKTDLCSSVSDMELGHLGTYYGNSHPLIHYRFKTLFHQLSNDNFTASLYSLLSASCIVVTLTPIMLKCLFAELKYAN